ncbi:MAG: hypothetical protein HY318_03110, partial [Armatimonadetes bacterium]|nr:hypothetical protein [Armatimonadota bacterium]
MHGLQTFLAFAFLSSSSSTFSAPRLQSFTVKESLNHRWADELVHFDLQVPTEAKRLVLTDAAGAPVPCQFTEVRRDGGSEGAAHTAVLGLPDNYPNAEVVLDGKSE